MNCMEILLLLGAVALTTASQYKAPEKRDHKFHYGGMYRGECGVDGIYWKDLTHLTFCTNGRTLDIPCAPGSRNADACHYTKNRYAHWEFCNVRVPVYHPKVHAKPHAHKHAPTHAYVHAPTHAYQQYAHVPHHVPYHAAAHYPRH